MGGREGCRMGKRALGGRWMWAAAGTLHFHNWSVELLHSAPLLVSSVPCHLFPELLDLLPESGKVRCYLLERSETWRYLGVFSEFAESLNITKLEQVATENPFFIPQPVSTRFKGWKPTERRYKITTHDWLTSVFTSSKAFCHRCFWATGLHVTQGFTTWDVPYVWLLQPNSANHWLDTSFQELRTNFTHKLGDGFPNSWRSPILKLKV